MAEGDRDLEKTLQRLHEEGIAGGVETAAGDGMHVWLGEEDRKIAAARIEPMTTAAGRRWTDAHAAARWLAETAARLFPASRFAQELKLARLRRPR
jgi:hypothetical protein